MSRLQAADAAIIAWHSAAGEGLYVSVLLRLAIAGRAIAAACRWPQALPRPRRSAQSAGSTVDLRWPNDLLIGERKTGGILVEAKTEGGMLAFAVVGIGINVHQRDFDPAAWPRRRLRSIWKRAVASAARRCSSPC